MFFDGSFIKYLCKIIYSAGFTSHPFAASFHSHFLQAYAKLLFRPVLFKFLSGFEELPFLRFFPDFLPYLL